MVTTLEHIVPYNPENSVIWPSCVKGKIRSPPNIQIKEFFQNFPWGPEILRIDRRRFPTHFSFIPTTIMFFLFLFSFIFPCPNCLLPYLLPFPTYPALPTLCLCSIGDPSYDDFIFLFSVPFLDSFSQYIVPRTQETAYDGRNNVIKYC